MCGVWWGATGIVRVSRGDFETSMNFFSKGAREFSRLRPGGWLPHRYIQLSSLFLNFIRRAYIYIKKQKCTQYPAIHTNYS